ncbi:MAG: hypothetical protein H7138_01480 [Myxococcales bacterium]|nr:hypothetical protein [Myxococcales bacterium]
MKKTRPTLVLRKEIIRILADHQLTKLIGGIEAAYPQSKDKQCPAPAGAAD